MTVGLVLRAIAHDASLRVSCWAFIERLRRVRVSYVWGDGGTVASVAGSVNVSIVPSSDVGDGGCSAREVEELQNVVCGGLLHHQPEDGSSALGFYVCSSG